MLRLARWLCAVLGGAILGAGLVLHGQVAMARYLRAEVDGTFFLWRAIGEATFAFQTEDHRMALAMAEVPEAAIRESARAAWVLVVVGSLLALTGPLLMGGAASTRPSPTKSKARGQR